MSKGKKRKVKTVEVTETNVFKGVAVEYTAEYSCFDRAGGFFETGPQMSANDVRMKDAYREKTGLLTSRQIAAIRAKYGIGQSDLSLLLGWEAGTVARYETHQVQDAAHDAVLRRLDADPEWFLKLLSEKERARGADGAGWDDIEEEEPDEDDLEMIRKIQSEIERFARPV